MTVNNWPRNLYTGVGGGPYTGVGGGLYAGGGGGLYAGADSEPYMSNILPWPYFLQELDKRGYQAQATLIRGYLPKPYWTENFFAR